MLSSLRISNYALIDFLEVDFSAGLNIITGETGAGKSIILGALSLLAGGRADGKAIRDRDGKTVVEAVFTDIPLSLSEFLREEGILDSEEDEVSLTLRRELSPSGRSRAFAGDSMVNLPMLQKIFQRLIDIHSQHQNIKLSQPEYCLDIIDSSFGSCAALRKDYESAFKEYVSLRSEYKKLKSDAEAAKENDEFLRFRLAQLDELAPKRGEQAFLEQRYELLKNSEEIRERLGEAARLIDPDDEDSALSKLEKLQGIFAKLPKGILSSGGDSADSIAGLDAVISEIKDMSESVAARLSDIGGDDRELEKTGRRLDDLYAAQMRFKVAGTDELADLHEQLRSQIAVGVDSGEKLRSLEINLKKSAARLKSAADSLTDARIEGAAIFAGNILQIARPLGLDNLEFKADLEKGKMSPSGQDRISFLASFNKKQPLRPLAQIASGGEISRLMLAIKSFTAGLVSIPTLILDEIDTGVSGSIADKMGDLMLSTSSHIQEIVITHLPQVAAKGESHYKVFKEDREDTTRTQLRRLASGERVEEIAKMLSGAEIGEAALMNARSLLDNSNKRHE